MRFEHEARLQQRVSHRNVARLFGAGEHRDTIVEPHGLTCHGVADQNLDELARSTRVLGTFLYWSRRF